ncbi:phenylacetic acid degradation protein PaaN [Streptomyces sp. NPDC101152]|uniref:phenylacetic acid degradation protein PaaN n=1 Tax=Streptomyces sp. NPDC101152 TaxID=3366116 RepID=UPI0037F1A6FF
MSIDQHPDFFARHADLLHQAVERTTDRGYWTPYPETPADSAYGAGASERGETRFRDLLDRHFTLDGHPTTGTVPAAEVSPYGFPLGISYPHLVPELAVVTAKAAATAWRAASPDVRAGVAAEILARLNAASFEIAHAVQHTTGQPFGMAFQAGGPNAQDRGLEAVAYAWEAQLRHPATARWSKPRRRGGALVMEKSYTPVGRGVAVLIACNTFPTWNGYPGFFASLVTGNPVVVKPHRRAVLPLAITVRIAREVLAGAGFDPDVVLLAASGPEERTAPALATHPDVRIVDFTGSSEFGDWLEDNARQAAVHTEKAGLNAVVVDSTDDYIGMLGNLAFSLALYSGQMCTTPQNILVPRDGFPTDRGRRTADEFASDLGSALDDLLGDPVRAAATLGAIVNGGILARLEEAAALDRTAHPSRAVTHPDHPDAVVRTPLVARLDAEADVKTYTSEWFGPVAFVIATDDTAHSLHVLHDTVRRHGGLTACVYASDEGVLAATRATALEAGVHLSENLTGDVFPNQSAAFSDFHGSSANPAANATLTDPAFVHGRFSVLQSRRPATAQEHDHV